MDLECKASHSETQYLELQSERNPLHRHRDSFDSEVRFAQGQPNVGSFRLLLGLLLR